MKILNESAIERLSDGYYAADGVYSVFESQFLKVWERMNLNAHALALRGLDVAPIFLIAPTLFGESSLDDSSDCQQYESSQAKLKIFCNDPVGYIRCEIDYLPTGVPTKVFWIKCTKGLAIMPDIQLIGHYEQIKDLDTLVEAVFYDLFFAEVPVE